jgi:hypothetical protein
MNYQELEAELANSYRGISRYTWETLREFKTRAMAEARQHTLQRLDKAKSTGPAIPQVRSCIYCHKPIKNSFVPLDIGGGLHVEVHHECYEALQSKQAIKPTKPVTIPIDRNPMAKAQPIQKHLPEPLNKSHAQLPSSQWPVEHGTIADDARIQLARNYVRKAYLGLVVDAANGDERAASLVEAIIRLLASRR